MAALLSAPPRTPSPKIRIHRSQSFDSPSSRISVTPIEDSPYSKSTGSITIPKPFPRYDALKAAEHSIVARNRVTLQTKMSDDSLMSDVSSSSSSSSTSSPTESEDGSQFGLFTSGSPTIPSPSPEYPAPRHRPANINTAPTERPPPPEILSSTLSVYQDMSTPMYDPWLVRVVLDMYDVRGFDWTMIAEPIERIWGFHTCTAEVLGILSGNGRLGPRWWD
jgi:hypothetical protein